MLFSTEGSGLDWIQ